MRELLQGFLDNDSFFGRIMTRIGMIIGANLMFVLFSMPIVPKIDPREFDLSQINEALKLVAHGHTDGKVMIRFS